MDEIFSKVINNVFPSLISSEKDILTTNLVEIGEYLSLKLKINNINFLTRLKIGNYRDSKAVINLLLPKFDYFKVKSINFLSEIRKDYNINELELNKKYLLNTINVVSDRLCVNWIDIFPLLDSKNIDGSYSEVIINNHTSQVIDAINTNDKGVMINAILKYWDSNNIKEKYANSIYYLNELEYSKTYEVFEDSNSKNYFDFFIFMMKDKNTRPWFSRYAYDLFSQIAIAHHFLHNKVLLVTGGTGVGKSTLIPRLLWYYNIIFTNKTCKLHALNLELPP